MDSTLLFFAFLLFSDMSKTCPSFQKAPVWGTSEAWAGSTVQSDLGRVHGPYRPSPALYRHKENWKSQVKTHLLLVTRLHPWI